MDPPPPQTTPLPLPAPLPFKPPPSGWPPNPPATPWGGPPPPPPLPENLLSDCTENCPLSPLRAPRRFRNPKIGQQLGAQPTPRFRVMSEAMSEAMSDVEIEAVNRPIAALHFLPPV